MLLQNKNAIIYGAGGSLGSAVAKAMAAAGCAVFLSGRNLEPVQKVADEIIAAGGNAHIAQVDALSKCEIRDHMAEVLAVAERVDISFNAIGIRYVQGLPLADIDVADFTSGITFAM